MPMTIEQLLEACGNDLYIDVMVEQANADGLVRGCEARKVVKKIGVNADILYGRGKDLAEALNNLLLQINKSE